MKKPKYIKDLTSYLNEQTGTTKDERTQWRECISMLMDAGRRDEAMKVFNSFQYWRENWLAKATPEERINQTLKMWDKL